MHAFTRMTLGLAMATVAVLAMMQPATAQNPEWTGYESDTVRLSQRQTYFVELDFSMSVGPGWTFLGKEDVPARPDAQHGSMTVAFLGPPVDGGHSRSARVSARILALPLDAAVTRSWLDYADGELEAMFPGAAQVSRTTYEGAVMATPFIMSKPFHVPYVSTDVVESLYEREDAEGGLLKIKTYSVWCLNIVATVIYVAPEAAFDAQLADFERMASSFWVQIAHPYKQ